MSRTLPRLAALAGVAALAIGLAACQTATPAATNADAGYVTPGKITFATGDPAYYPYVIDDDPTSGDGFESAVAYAVAAQLGFNAADVVWVRSTFDDAIAPGPKAYDINLQQVSISDDRAANIDFSSEYYAAGQAVITTAGSAADGVTSIAGLKGLLIGAATGTTSLTAVEKIIAPTAGAQVFNSNDDAKLALVNGQVDAIVVDVPTAFYITGVELDAGVIVGSLPSVEGQTDEWGLVLAKDSPLTAKVTAAVDALRADGSLDKLVAKWLGSDQGVAELK
ncbi:MAG: transporter substrate-binding domain-containing protein [Pseudolysinimonas sp.]